jgi:Na+-transporting methylmalonyl-CoA/oxaloacetate decarboxylase gamma subunit
MDGMMISINTAIITIVISFFIAIVIKLMTMILDKFSKPEEEIEQVESTVAESSDESEIAAVIAIAHSRK